MSVRGLISTTLAWFCAAVGFLLLAGAPASAAVPAGFGSMGEGAGQFKEPRGMAVDQGNGDVYIVDRNNNRLDKFTAEGAFLMAWGWGVADGTTEALQVCTVTCFGGLGGAAAGQFGPFSAEGVAVDNDPLSSSYEDVYVVDKENHRVEEFSPTGEFLLMFGGIVNEGTKGNICLAGEKCEAGKMGLGEGEFYGDGMAIAVGPNGVVYVGDMGRVQEFSSGGGYIGQFANTSGGCTTGLAIDSVGDIYLVESNKNPDYPEVCGSSGPGVLEYDSSGVLLKKLEPEGDVRNVAIDSADDVFVDEVSQSQGEKEHLVEYSSAGIELSRFAPSESDGSNGLAWGDTLGRLYAVSQSAVRLVSPPPPGPLLVGGEAVNGVTSTSATLNATINPEDHAARYRFEYGPTESYGKSAPVPEGSLAASFNDEPVQVKIKGLTAGTTYHYRVVATDSEGHFTDGTDETFTTLPAVSIDGVSVSEVASTSATFGARINPLGAEASYQLEYGTSTAYGTVISEGSLGDGSSDVTVGPVQVQGLSPDTVYHYRVVAFDEREGVPYTIEGPDQLFTTQAPGSELTLLDGRQWELVSPPDHHGASFSHISESGVIQASASGDAMTYLATLPTEAEPRGYHEGEQVLSRRESGVWASRDIATAHSAPSGPVLAHGEEYRFFSEDLSLGLVEPWDERYFTSLAPEVSPPDTETTVYLRHNDTCDQTPATCYMPLVTGAPGYADVLAGTKFGDDIQFVGATSDLSHVVLFSGVGLTSEPPNGGGLYEWAASPSPSKELQPVSVLPNGMAANGGELGSGRNTRHAISADGSRVFWSDNGHLYMWDAIEGKTIQLDVPEPGAPRLGVESRPIFQVASSDGSRVLFTDSQPLTSDAGSDSNQGTEGDLYECIIVETAGGNECKLSDLTPTIAGQSADVQGGVLGASEDASYVYFVADGVLNYVANEEGEKATQGDCSGGLGVQPPGVTCNLYLLHYDATSGQWEAPRFVAVLSGEDGSDWSFEPSGLTSRVSPNGRYLAFMSDRSLTGYDNHDAASGAPDEEVYLYDADGNAGAGRLVCASCNPSGALPVGVEWDGGRSMRLAAGGRINWADTTWLAANLPGWTSFGESEAAYQSRYLSDEGRLFFNSHDALVSQDVDGTEDVYEYEPAGTGSCLTSSSTFGRASDGCVDLISSGTSAQESAFLDASESGGDVFFLTTEKLVRQEVDDGLAVYDAHACTEQSPCFSSPAPSPACTTVESCRAAPTPRPAIFGDPSSATFSGAGNVASPLPVPAVRPKMLTRAQKLTAALKACRGQKGHRRQVSCEGRARKRYGPRIRAKKTSATSRKRGGMR